MTTAKAQRSIKRQLGQFMTPPNLASRVLDEIPLRRDSILLEPSFGDGSFLLPVLRKLVDLNDGDLLKVLRHQLFGCEIDPTLFDSCVAKIAEEFDLAEAEVRSHNLHNEDFFRCEQIWRNSGQQFDVIVGNPPFGGTFAPDIEDALDRRFGKRNGYKIKKETYSFFILASVELLARKGCLRFICSDTFLTIKTMLGLREYLVHTGEVAVEDLDHFSNEVSYPLVVLNFVLTEPLSYINVNNKRVSTEAIDLTGNRSWSIRQEHIGYFSGWPTIGEYFQCSSGMTVGKNEVFVREISDQGRIEEPYDFEFYYALFTVEEAVRNARLNKLGPQARRKAEKREAAGELVRQLRVSKRQEPLIIEFPHDYYRPYNRASSGLFYEESKHAIYWRDDGDAVLTFKKTGPWYLRGVGGQSLFGREGVTWPLVASRIRAKYLPPGRILDSGSPVAIPRQGVDRREIFFLLGWLLTNRASELLKSVLNHTRNIQGKDVERLPYPAWVPRDRRDLAMDFVKNLVERGIASKSIQPDGATMARLEELYALDLRRSSNADGLLTLPMSVGRTKQLSIF